MKGKFQLISFDRTSIFIAKLTYISLLSLSIYFYKERSIFLDSSFYLFYLIKDGEFTITHNRFASILTQILPFIGLKFSASLPTLMMLFSLGFVLVNFLLFLIILLFKKSSKYALSLLLFNILIVSDSFYWMVSEFPLGISLSIFYISLFCLTNSNSKWFKYWFIPTSLLFQTTIVFSYPLVIFPFVFILIYLYLIEKIVFKNFLSVLVSFSTIFILKISLFKSGYEANSSLNGVKNLVELFPNYLNIQSNIDFLKYLLNDYYALPIGLLLILIYYWKNKSYKKILLVTISFFFYLFIINISYPNGGDQFYIENLYLPLSIFIIFPLVYEVLPSYNRKVSLFIFIAIVLSSITRIYYNHESYTERLNWMRNYMELTKGADNKKQFIDAENVPTNVLIMTWATPYEFWLLSTIELNYTRSILIDKNLENHSWMLPYNKKFATKWGAFNYSELPTKYFKLTDTTHYSLENLLIINN